MLNKFGMGLFIIGGLRFANPPYGVW